MSRPLLGLALAVLAAVAACGSSTLGGPSPTASVLLALPELKYRIFDQVGQLWYCDPDFYPIARNDELSLALARFAEVQRDVETYRAILRHARLDTVSELTSEQKLVVYRDWKRLNALRLEPAGAAYRFTIRVQGSGGAKTGSLVEGTIDQYGSILVTKREPAGPPNCPICLSSGTRIDTPSGPVVVTELRAGMTVWTQGASGAREAAVLLAVASVAAPAGHEVVRIVLADGRELLASPGHPTADGRTLGDLALGASLDGSTVVLVERVPYGGRTYDLLPAGASGTYWANGVLLRSTLRARYDTLSAE